MKIKNVKHSQRAENSTKTAPLSDELVERIRRYKRIFGDVDPDTLEETIEDFQQSRHRERKIKSWEQIAEVYQSYISENSITDFAAKQAVFYVALGGSLGRKSGFFGHGSLLSKAQIEDIISHCKRVLRQDVM